MKKVIFMGGFLVFFLINLSALCDAKLIEKKYELGSVPRGYKLISASVLPSMDLNHLSFVCISKDKKNMIAIIDGKPTIEFYRIAKNYPRFSPDGKHFVLIGKIGTKAYLLYDSQLSKPYDIIYKALFTKDNKLIYIAKEGEKEYLIVDGNKWSGYKRIAEKISPVVSPDNKKIAIVALKDNGKTVLSVNNGEIAQYDLILNPIFSPDSSHLAFVVKIGDKYRVVLDNNFIGHEYDEVKDLTFSSDSKKFAFVAREGKKFFVVLNGKKLKKFEYVGQPIFSHDSKHLAYMAYKRKKMFIVLDENIGPKLDQIGIYYFSKANKLYYMGVLGKKGAVFIDNKPEKFYDTVGLPVSSPDGKHLAYRVREGKKWFVVLDGKKGPEFDYVRKPVFSKNGLHMAYIAIKDKKYLMVIDNKPQKKYNWVDFPYFSNDGKHVAYVASDEKGSFMVIDNMESKDRFLGFLKGVPLYFQDNCVRGQAIKTPGPIFYKVEVCF